MAEVEHFDVLVIGTSLSRAILAAALSMADYRVVHVDSNDYYGQSDTCISPPFRAEVLQDYVSEMAVVDGPALSQLHEPREYNIELAPKILYTNSKMIQVLRDLNISDYVQFKALSVFHLLNDDGFTKVPSSREDIFTNPAIALIEKRRLMKFLKFASQYKEDELFANNGQTCFLTFVNKEFRLTGELVEAIAYSLGQASSTDALVEDVLPTIETHLQSLGIFGSFPAVVPMYGAASELTQAFCRKSAVKGCTYILGQSMEQRAPKEFALSTGMMITAKEVVEPEPSAHTANIMRRIVIVQGEFHDMMGSGDACCVSFSPEKGQKDVVQCQIHGSGTGACPADQSLLYFSAPQGSKTQFDRAQERLFKGRDLQLITALDYFLKGEAAFTSYDAILHDAREMFTKLTHGSKEFLPAEPDTSEDTEL